MIYDISLTFYATITPQEYQVFVHSVAMVDTYSTCWTGLTRTVSALVGVAVTVPVSVMEHKLVTNNFSIILNHIFNKKTIVKALIVVRANK